MDAMSWNKDQNARVMYSGQRDFGNSILKVNAGWEVNFNCSDAPNVRVLESTLVRPSLWLVYGSNQNVSFFVFQTSGAKTSTKPVPCENKNSNIESENRKILSPAVLSKRRKVPPRSIRSLSLCNLLTGAILQHLKKKILLWNPSDTV